MYSDKNLKNIPTHGMFDALEISSCEKISLLRKIDI